MDKSLARASVCIVSELPPPGGMAVQAKLLTENLRRKGHAVFNASTNPLRRTSGHSHNLSLNSHTIARGQQQLLERGVQFDRVCVFLTDVTAYSG